MAQRALPSPTDPEGPKKVTPVFFSKDTGGGLPHLDATPPYILAHHPNRYMVMAGLLVPSPSRIALVDGVNRVRVAPDGRIYFADAQAKLQNAHFKLIPYELGPGGESYLQSIDTRPNGREAVKKAVISVWETAHAGSPVTETDEEGYATWLASLVEDGHLPACPAHVAAKMLETARGSLKDAEQKRATGKLSDLSRIESLQAEVAALEKVAGKGAAVRGKRTSFALGDEEPPPKGKGKPTPKKAEAAEGEEPPK